MVNHPTEAEVSAPALKAGVESVVPELLSGMAAQLTSVSQLGLRSLFLVNGGALIAVLSLLGSIWGKPGAADLAHRLQPAARELIVGLVCAFLATAMAYVSQLAFIDFRATRWGFRIGRGGQIGGLVLSALSLAFFAWGVSSGVSAIGKRTVLHETAALAVWSTIQHGST